MWIHAFQRKGALYLVNQKNLMEDGDQKEPILTHFRALLVVGSRGVTAMKCQIANLY